MFGKRFLLALLSLGFVSSFTFFGNETPLLAEEETSQMPKGWNVSITDSEGNDVSTPYLSAKAYKDIDQGNCVTLYRRISANNITVYSDQFSATPNSSIRVSFKARSNCLDDEENRLSFSIKEYKENGTYVSSEIGFISGRQGWKNVSGFCTTSETCSSLVIEISASGYGDFYVSDISLFATEAPYISLGTWALIDSDGTNAAEVNYGKPESAKGVARTLTASSLTDDAYSGDKALKLTNQGILTTIGSLPVGDYKLNFKYKGEADLSGGVGAGLSIRLDCFAAGNRRWYANAAKPAQNNTNGKWAEYSLDFKRTIDISTSWFSIFAYGTYIFDDIQILDSEGYNYIASGNFDGYKTNGISIEGFTGIVENEDESYDYYGVYNDQFIDASDTVVTFSGEKLSLTEGEEYTLSYKTRGGNDKPGLAIYNNVELGNSQISETWTDFETKFVAVNNADLKIKLNSSTSSGAYLKDISIKDKDGNECFLLNPVKDNGSAIEGEEIFPYGGFEYDFKEEESSSSSSEDETFTRETKEESSSSETISSKEPISSSVISSSKQDSSSNSQASSNGCGGAIVGTSVGIFAALGIVIITFVRRNKHE